MANWVFSGTIVEDMARGLDLQVEKGNFVPCTFLTTQVDRSGVKQQLRHKREHKFIKDIFIDSGAFSVHRGNATCDVDEYIEFANSLDDDASVFAQLDTIPGKFGQPKTKQDYEESAQKSWENFLYMYPKMKSPNKLMPIFHHGESFDALKRMLDWRDENGNQLTYLGLSPANDRSQQDKDAYLSEVFDFIQKSSNPNVKTHLYGMTSLQALAKFPAYSADSISARLIAGYNKIYTQKWGVISLSDKSRTSKTKSNMAFDRTCDPKTLQELKDLCASYDYTLEQMKEDNCARTVLTMCEIQKANNTTYAFKPGNFKRQKKLFSI